MSKLQPNKRSQARFDELNVKSLTGHHPDLVVDWRPGPNETP